MHSADQAFNYLPSPMKSNPVLITRGRGNQRGIVKRPRMVMAKPDGTFYAAFMTDKTSKAYDSAEFAQLNSESNELDFYLLEFTNGRPVLHMNPAICMSCHQLGTKRHLRAEPYSMWAGWLGTTVHSDGREKIIREEELKRIAEFMLEKPDIPRLSHLNLDLSSPSYHNVWPLDEINTRFNFIASKTQGKILFESIRRNLSYEDFKYALAVPLDDEKKGQDLRELLTHAQYEQYMKDRGSIIEELREREKLLLRHLDRLFIDVYGGGLRSRQTRIVGEDYAFVEWVMRQMGDSLSNYSTSGVRPSPLLNDGFPSIGTGILRTLRIQILKEIALSSGIKEPFEYSSKYDHLVDVITDEKSIDKYVGYVRTHSCASSLGDRSFAP
jgi:hypothetical protein